MTIGALSWPRHLLTFAEWDALPECELYRLELVEGVLVNSPQPSSWHQRAVGTLTRELNTRLPMAVIALHRVAVVLEDRPPTVRVPDVVVTPTPVYERNPSYLGTSEVVLAAEIVSDGTRRVDWVLKFSEYADAGIGQYWIVDLDPPTTLTAYLLVDGDYELVGESTGAAELDVAGHPVGLDLAALTRR